ncbi:RNA-binding protein [Peribacillus cavernae]|uniref:RNA-binding protein n=1 Tax=Peribacillus cavernae TaxID=1674310 RepID=A0A3S0U3S0_9BACI|nr:RNA-binding protein [Peribacillus cavernae]MDQ0217158.1 RNA-binding protein YlmH [Peribacillus cavernae]RUQ30368.1 RNA-binding protein [Peribacillus cavernae]
MSIYQHFRPEEREFIDQALNWIGQARNLYAPKLTDFLDPRGQLIVQTLLGEDEEISLFLYGGSDKAERKRAILCPNYFSPAESDYRISLFDVVYPKKFVTLDHRQVLGTLMSLGLKREKYGDIIISGEHIQVVAAAEIETYLLSSLEKIGKASVTIKKRELTDILQPEESWDEQTITVSSMRLDTVISSVINLSRQKAQMLISSGKVKMNFKQIESTSAECREGDTLSIRGFGRCRILSIEGKTKKDKWRISVGRQK